MVTVRTETIEVGRHDVSEPGVVEEILTRADIALTTGLSSIGSVAAEVLSPPVPAARLSASTWTAPHPVLGTDSVRADVVVTAVATDSVERSVQLIDDSGRIREHGTQVWKLAVPGAVPISAAVDFCTTAWGQIVADRLASDTAFASSLDTWDGTIGLRCGERELHLRVYRGRIIDVTRRTPLGATFTFIASPRKWTDIAFDTNDNFMRRAIAGEFSSAGDGYEYLRLTKPLNILMSHVRDIAQEAQS